MSQLGWGIKQFKSSFFDADGIKKKLDKATRKTLSKAGAFIRTRAKSSIRKRKKAALPGQPPSSHEGSLKRLIFFAYDANSKSVVIGPVKFRAGEAPRLLEHGGTTSRRTVKHGTKRLVYRGNPFMKPAALAEMTKFRELFRNSMR